MQTNTRLWAAITAGILSLAGCASAASLGSEKYTYDASGNITSKSIDGVVTRMAYDQANRLIELQTAGQGKESTAYDNAGRPVTERNADGQTIRSLSYGYGDKVLETQTQDSKAGFYYNAEGQLVGKKIHGNVSTYTWDGNVLAADNSEVFTNENHITGGVPVMTGDQNIVISDYLGNTFSQGNTEFSGMAYGQGVETVRFTGKPYIKELESFVFQHRMYSPEKTRWTIPDPAGFPNGINNYTYVNSDPLALVDPSGLVAHEMTDPDTEVFVPVLEDNHMVYGQFDPHLVVKTQNYTLWVTTMIPCSTPVAMYGMLFSTSGTFLMPNLGQVTDLANPALPIYTIDETTIDDLMVHETGHRTHYRTIANKTYGALETWSASYEGNHFSSMDTASLKGHQDLLNGLSLAFTTYNTQCQRTIGHELDTENDFLAPDANKCLRNEECDWGGPLNALLQEITINFYKNASNCEN